MPRSRSARRSAGSAGRLVLASLVVGMLGGCAGAGASSPPVSVAATAAAVASPTPAAVATPRPSPMASAVPTPAPPLLASAFAGISLGAVSDETAARYQAVLVPMAGSVGATATVMTVHGTWSGAAGTADGSHDLVAESQFGIASVTKSVIAAQVMLLVESGELRLDAPATDYLPAALDFDTNGATVRQLLDMHAGIPDWYTGPMEWRVTNDRARVWEPAEVLALVDPARHPVDAEFEYADTNYTLLGLVIEHVRRQPLVDVLRDGVLRVAGTERLVYQPAEAPTDPMAMPLGEPRTALERGAGYLPSLADASSAGPAGAIASDSISLARWWRAFCSGEIVSQASLTEMSTFVGGPDGYGLGVFNPADGWASGIGHLGSNFGYVSWAACLSDIPAIVVVLTNRTVDDIGGLAKPLVDAARLS